jgi:hypothetical protein
MQDGVAAVATGKAEFGPRALGNRSILADPRDPNIKDRVNLIKQRELFRPFAPVIMEEYASEWFDMDDTEQQYRIIQATEYVDNMLIWTSKLKSLEQSLNFPREDFEDRQGRTVSSDSVPTKIKQATALVVYVGLSQDLYDDGVLLSSETYGKASESYFKPVRAGGSVELRNLRQNLLRLGYGRSGTSVVEVDRA